MNHQEPQFPPVLWPGQGDAGPIGDAEIWNSVEDHGAALIRGTKCDPDGFYRLAGRFNRAFLTSPFGDRRTLRTNAELQTVTLGRKALDLHFEYGSSPFRPDLLWLYCHRPASEGAGGETLIADGAEVFDHVSRDTQKVLALRRIRHRTSVPRKAFDAMQDRNQSLREVLGGDLLESLRANRDVAILKLDANNVTFEYSTSPVARSRDGRTYVCQAISTDAYARPTDEGADVKFNSMTTWEDGSDIEASLISEIEAATRAIMKPIGWRQGDCLVINNRRVLHGRNDTTDPNRMLFILCSFSTRYGSTPADLI